MTAKHTGEESGMTTDRITTRTERRRVSRCGEVPIRQNDAETLRRDLDGWLESRNCWSHEEWLSLLGDLRQKGYSDLIDTPKGQELIGRYLENNKKCGSC